MSFWPIDHHQQINTIRIAFQTNSSLILFSVPPKLAPFAISDEPLHLGDYFQLTCAVVHGDFPYNITWYFNDEPITYIDGVTILMHGKRSSSLNIESVSAAHPGNYSCVSSSIAGRASISTTLSIRGLCLLIQFSLSVYASLYVTHAKTRASIIRCLNSLNQSFYFCFVVPFFSL